MDCVLPSLFDRIIPVTMEIDGDRSTIEVVINPSTEPGDDRLPCDPPRRDTFTINGIPRG